MQVTCREDGTVRVLGVAGRIDHAHAAAFEEALAPYLKDCTAGAQPLVLDFSGVDYISSIGLRALLLASRQVKQQNGRIAIAALTPNVAEVFAISRFNLVLRTFSTCAAAGAELAT